MEKDHDRVGGLEACYRTTKYPHQVIKMLIDPVSPENSDNESDSTLVIGRGSPVGWAIE